MSERGQFRNPRSRGGGGHPSSSRGGGGGDNRGRGGRGRGNHPGSSAGGPGGRGGGGGGGAGEGQERPKKENILDLAKYMDKQIRVKFSGGREGMIIFLSIHFLLSPEKKRGERIERRGLEQVRIDERG